jgi:hypothetical protein
MTEDQRTPPSGSGGSIVGRLIAETGITEVQARELIVFLGLNWSSLLREARILKDRH